MKTAAECLGENLKRLRRERDLTQGELAKAARLSLGFLQAIELGRKWAGPGTITALSRALRVTESDLFADHESGKEPDAKQILLLVCRAFGARLTEEMTASIKFRAPISSYWDLYERMPEEVSRELTRLCRDPDWDWEKFRSRYRA